VSRSLVDYVIDKALEHPDTLTSMNSIACMLERQGRYRAAEQMHQQALELRREALGPEHPAR
jgi:Tfp pilus assembly protein PilF